MDPQPSAVSNGNVNTPSASTSFYLPVFSIHINQTSSPPHNSYLAAYYQRLFTPELLFQTIKEGKLTFIQLAFETRYTPIDLSLVRENSKKQLESVISKQIEILLKQEIKSYQAEAIRKYLNEFSSQEAKVKILNQDLNVAVNTGCATVLKYYERNYLKKCVSCVRQGDVLEYKGNACALTNNDGETKLQLNQFVSRLALDTQGLLQNNAKLYHLAFQADAQNPAAFRQHLIKTRDRLSQEESTAEAQYKYYEKGRLQFEMEVGSNDEIRRVEREQRIKVHDFLENWQEGAPSNLEKTLFNLFGLKKTDPDFEKEFEKIFLYPHFDFRNKKLLYLAVVHQRLEILKQLLIYYRMENSNPLEEDNEKVPLLYVLLHPLDIENGKTKKEKIDFILAAFKALFGVAEEVEKSQASSSKASSDSLIKKAREKIREFFYKTNHLEKTVMEIVLEKNQSRLIDYVLKSHIEPQRSDLCLSLQQNKTSQRLSLFLKSAYEIMQNYEDELRKREEYYENTLQGLRQGGKWDEFDDETISLENTSPHRCLLRRRDLNALWLAWDLAIYLRNDQHFAQEVFLRADRAKSYISLSQGSKLFDPLYRLATQFMHYEIDGQGRKKELIVSNKERREIEKIKNQSQQQHSQEMRQVMARLDAQEARHRTQGEAQEARHRTQGEAQEARHREEMHVQAQQLLILMSMLTPEQQERIRQSMAAATTPSHPRSASDTGASSVFRSSAGLPPKKTAAASASSSSHPASPPSSEPEPQRSRTPIFTFFGEEEGGEGIEPLPSSREGGYAELVDSDSEEGTSPRTGQQGKRKT